MTFSQLMHEIMMLLPQRKIRDLVEFLQTVNVI